MMNKDDDDDDNEAVWDDSYCAENYDSDEWMCIER